MGVEGLGRWRQALGTGGHSEDDETTAGVTVFVAAAGCHPWRQSGFHLGFPRLKLRDLEHIPYCPQALASSCAVGRWGCEDLTRQRESNA